MLKTTPLLAPLFGILRRQRYTHQWASLLILLYVTEGAVRATSDTGFPALLAALELALALTFFAASVGYARLTRRPSVTTAD